MTPKEKIITLVEHIKKEFPEGCKEMDCDNCELRNSIYGTTEQAICIMLRDTLVNQW